MSALRAVRPTALKVTRSPAIMAYRFYSPSDNTRPEGQTGSSKGFSEREKAQEKMFIEKREKDKLKEAKAKLEAAKKEVEEQEKKVNEQK